MKHTIYVQTKNIDLDAMSAKEALIDYLKIDAITNLQRATVWEIQIDTPDTATAQAQLQHLLKTSFYLANPNKEVASLTCPFQSDAHIILLKTSAKNHENLPGLVSKIRQKTGVPVTECYRATLWAITIKDGTDRHHIIQKAGRSTSSTNGLLANAISQTIHVIECA